MGAGHLPFVGGSLEQPSALMRSLDIMNGVEAKVRERERKG
jgi:hypothetical protein